MKAELKLIPIILLCAFLSIFGHLILSKAFHGGEWVEYTAALIPFLLIIIAYASFKYAQRAINKEGQ
ncbi:hypothetical protein [Aliivibrio kagoshimensis]|uniref:hypothetical protein n=1 Tax=Aliivibrio kagoshimensis TaxID=2910230 RepID=UPI003D1188D8